MKLSRMKKNQNNLYSFSNVIIIDCFDAKNVIRFSKLRVTLKHILQRSTEIEIFWWSRFSVLDWMFNTTEEIADDFIATNVIK